MLRDDTVEPGSERTLLRVTMLETGLLGGMLTFDPGGSLLVGIGDGKSMEASRDPQRPQGKILRLDVDSETPYSEDPVVVASGSHRFPELVAMGLRNPWRFDVDERNGDLIIADVGHGAWEEVDRLPAGSGVLDLGGARWRARSAGPPSPVTSTAPHRRSSPTPRPDRRRHRGHRLSR